MSFSCAPLRWVCLHLLFSFRLYYRKEKRAVKLSQSFLFSVSCPSYIMVSVPWELQHPHLHVLLLMSHRSYQCIKMLVLTTHNLQKNFLFMSNNLLLSDFVSCFCILMLCMRHLCSLLWYCMNWTQEKLWSAMYSIQWRETEINYSFAPIEIALF